MSTEQALRAALTEMIAGIGECACHEGYTSRKLKDPDCRYHDNLPETTQARAALALPATEVTLEYRALHQISFNGENWNDAGSDREYSAEDLQGELNYLRHEALYSVRNITVESRVVAGPWLPVVQP